MTDSPTKTSDRPQGSVQSVDRALIVLEIIARSGSAGVTAIADELGVHKSTISRLIGALESRGYVEQMGERGKYRLGFSIVRLAGAAAGQRDVSRIGQTTCDELAAKVGETVNLAILDGDRAINILEARADSEVALRTWVGQSSPAHATSSGKILLSGMAPDDVRDLLPNNLESYTTGTIVTIGALSAELDTARARGWASVHEELEIGLNAVSAPVRDHTRQVISALSVSGPSYRLDPTAFGSVAARAVDAADEISRKLGYVPA